MWVVYLLHAAHVTIPASGKPGSRDTYVGMTNRLEYRVKRHNLGAVAATRGRAWKLVAWMRATDREHAAVMERYLKCGDTRKKRQLMALNATDGLEVSATITQQLYDAVELWLIKRNHKLACTMRDQPELAAIACHEPELASNSYGENEELHNVG